MGAGGSDEGIHSCADDGSASAAAEGVAVGESRQERVIMLDMGTVCLVKARVSMESGGHIMICFIKE